MALTSGTERRHVAVIDIGKTNVKLALVDTSKLCEVATRRMANRPLDDGTYPHHDTDSIWHFILESLAAFRREFPIDAIAVTTHGATAAIVGADGELVLPILDYEFAGPDATSREYERVRPAFAETGSPPLPLGLNLGAQLFWQSRAFAVEFVRATAILMYPQYWAFRLCGVAASEVTSLGCHTDLWNPFKAGYSPLVGRMSWRRLFPAMRRAHDCLGPVLPAVAEATGLDPAAPVFCGIHDSNASLLPHLAARKPPFAVVSTGTWVIAMAIGGRRVELDPARDTLVNVNAFGEPVPSARFMGGREFERMIGNSTLQWDESDLDAVLAEPTLLLPAVQIGSGPFANQKSRWIGTEPSGGRRFLAVSFYLALTTATCLDLAGAEGEIVVEGAFGENPAFLEMLAAATGMPVVRQTGNQNGTSIGAALLAIGMPTSISKQTTPGHRIANTKLIDYANIWKSRIRFTYVAT